MLSASKPSWQQVTALVSLSASGTVTGFSFVPHSPTDLMSPTSMPIRLMALERSVKPAASGDAALRSAIVNVANYYLLMAKDKTPAEMEAIIWQHDSVNGIDHGESCAAFASLTLELAARVVGQQSWVTGGTSYPWPLQKWADVRVDPNSSSPNIISVLQDAEEHGRWHPLGDGYQPQPGDWVLFDNHVEVVTRYADGTLDTIGGDSLPNLSVNAHEYAAPLSGDGIAGFVNNGDVPASGGSPASATGGAATAVTSASGTANASGATATATTSSDNHAPVVKDGATGSAAIPGATSTAAAGTTAASDDPAVPGTSGSMIPADSSHLAHQTHRDHAAARTQTPARDGATSQRHAHATHANPATTRAAANADVPGMTGSSEPITTAQATSAGSAAVPGVAAQQATATTPYQRHQPTPDTPPVQGTTTQQAFIKEIAPGAIATQQKYGVPAAVTIAQAIDESGWGESSLATQDNNLFGIKGEGPAGSDSQPTQEYENGQWVTIDAGFRVYENVTQSIDDHGELLATSGFYTKAMANRDNPDAFANALTGVYATNPQYGSDLIQLMQQYGLYRYDASGAAAGATADTSGTATHASTPARGTAKPGKATQPSLPGLTPTASPSPASTPTQPTRPTAAPTTTATAHPTSSPTGTGHPTPSPTGSAHATPAPTASAQPTPAPTPTTTAAPSGTSHATRTSRRSATTRPAPAASSTPARSASAAAAQAPTPSIPGWVSPATPQPRTSNTPQPRTSRAQQSRTARTPQAQASRARATRSPEPLVSPTYDAGWAAGAGMAVGGAMTELRRRSKRSQRGNAVDPDDQRVSTTMSSTLTTPIDRPVPAAEPWPPAEPDPDRAPVRRYQHHLPTSVKNDFVAMARGPLLHGELLYRDIADSVGLSWELLAACDWMQCQARPRYSPVHGEKLGARNHDGTVYWSRSEALAQCAMDLVGLADAVYGIDLTTKLQLSVADLARVFAAFRWGALLRRHRTSAMEFPYSVAGLTVQHMNMRWPTIGDPNTPDKPGARFRKPFGAVPIVLSLHYPATV